MDVKYFGFSINTATDKIPLGNYFSYLSENSGFSNDSGPNERLFYIDDSSDDYFKGLIVTVKDQKVYCKYSQNSGRVVIEVENIGHNSKMLDFNFFVIRKSNGIGLYQHYHQSCSLRGAGEYLKKYYRDYRKMLIDEAISVKISEKGSALDEKEEKQIRSNFKDQLEFATLAKPGEINTIMAQYRRAKAFEYEFAQLTPEINSATPLAPYVIRKKEKIFFSPVQNITDLGNSVLRFVNSAIFKKGRITLEKDDGGEETIQVENIPDCFHTEDYDSLTVKINGLDSESFHSHPYIQEMIDICESEQNRHIFLAEVRDE